MVSRKLHRNTLINLNCLEILFFLILFYLHKWRIPPSIAIVEISAPKNVTRFHYQDTIYLPRRQPLAIVGTLSFARARGYYGYIRSKSLPLTSPRELQYGFPAVALFSATSKPNIMLGHNVIYVDTICLCGLHGWSSDSHQSNLSFKSQSFLSPWGSVRVKEHAFPRSSPLTFTITAITSLRKKFFSLPPIPLCHESGDLLCVYHLVHSLGEFLAPPLLKIT